MNVLRLASTYPDVSDTDSEAELLRLEQLTARRADRIRRRAGEDDLSVWQRAEAEIFGAPLAPLSQDG